MPRVYLADKDTLDNVNDKVGTSSDTASSAPTTLFAGIKHLISVLADHVANWTATRAAKIDKLDNLGATGDTGGSATAGTLMAKLNALLTSWTSTRAGYLDKLNNATYGLEALKGYVDEVESLLKNSTYGLSAIKNNGVPVSSLSGKIIKSNQTGVGTLENKTVQISLKTTVTPKNCIVLLNGGFSSGGSVSNYVPFPYLVSLTSTTLTVGLTIETDSNLKAFSYQVIEFY